VQANFRFAPGQVGQLGIFGIGESTFAITSKPSDDFVQFSVMRAGEVTKALHNLSVGDKVGIRAPMGNGFPVEQWKGKNILFVMGGIGSAALKATIEYILANRADYGKVSILFGATVRRTSPTRRTSRTGTPAMTSNSCSPSTRSATAGSAKWVWCPPSWRR
jgi:NAD(P)H-flavin reductase